LRTRPQLPPRDRVLEMKQVIVMRTDLKMRKGKMIAQGAHASERLAHEYWECRSALGSQLVGAADAAAVARFVRVYEEWCREGNTKIVVGVDDEAALQNVLTQASAAGIATASIVDAGRTEFHGQEMWTCVAIGPDEDDRVDAITGSLRLL
jgi:peptidyl-tRNA hydrolase, PTH2 family